MSEPTEPAGIHHGLALYQRGQGHLLAYGSTCIAGYGWTYR